MTDMEPAATQISPRVLAIHDEPALCDVLRELPARIRALLRRSETELAAPHRDFDARVQWVR